jgi:transcriptional regulator with XRE-family HTH domain
MLRHRSNIRVSDLADAVGISRPHLSNLERGGRWPSDDIVISLARVLGVKPSMVARRSGDRYAEAHKRVADWRPLSPAERVHFEAEFCGPE